METKYSLGERVVCPGIAYNGVQFVSGYLTNAIIINIETKTEGEEQTYVVKNDDGVYWVRRESEIAPIELDPGELKIHRGYIFRETKSDSFITQAINEAAEQDLGCLISKPQYRHPAFKHPEDTRKGFCIGWHTKEAAIESFMIDINRMRNKDKEEYFNNNKVEILEVNYTIQVKDAVLP